MYIRLQGGNLNDTFNLKKQHSNFLTVIKHIRMPGEPQKHVLKGKVDNVTIVGQESPCRAKIYVTCITRTRLCM